MPSWPTTSSGTRSGAPSRVAARTSCAPRWVRWATSTIKYELHDVVANDDHAIALGTATATRNGKTLVYRTAEIFHIRDGKATERWAFSDDTAEIVAFFA